MDDVILRELQELKNMTRAQAQEYKNLMLLVAKQALTMSDASLLTGLSMSCLYKKVSAKQIPYYKSQGGKLTYFDKDELTQWCLSIRVRTDDEVASEAVTHAVTGKKRIK